MAKTFYRLLSCLDYILAHSGYSAFLKNQPVVSHNIGFWRVLMPCYFCIPSVKQHIFAFRCSSGLFCLQFVFCCHGIHSLWLNHCPDIMYIFTESLMTADLCVIIELTIRQKCQPLITDNRSPHMDRWSKKLSCYFNHHTRHSIV